MKGLLFVLLLGSATHAANPVVSVIDSRTFQLQDGTKVRLANTEELVSETNRKSAKIALQLWLLDRNVQLSNQVLGEWDGVMTADVVWRGLNIGDRMVQKGYLLRPGSTVERSVEQTPIQVPQQNRRVYRTYQAPSYEVYQGSSYYPSQGTVCVGNT